MKYRIVRWFKLRSNSWDWCFISLGFCRLFVSEVVLSLLWLVDESVWRESLIFDAYGKHFSGTIILFCWLSELHVFIFVWKSFSFADIFVICVTVVWVFTIPILSFLVSIFVYRCFTLDGYGEHRLRFKFSSFRDAYYSSINVSFIGMAKFDLLDINGISRVVGDRDDDGCWWVENYFAIVVVLSNMVFFGCEKILFHLDRGTFWEIRLDFLLVEAFERNWCIGSWWRFFCLMMGIGRITECCLAGGSKVKYLFICAVVHFCFSVWMMWLAILIRRFIDCIFICSNDSLEMSNHLVCSNMRSFCAAWIASILSTLSWWIWLLSLADVVFSCVRLQ